MAWLGTPGLCNSPHSVSNRNLFKSSQGHTSPKASSAYFSPCTKNVLARVKSDNSLKHQMLNNQKLIQDNLCVGTGSCEKSHILLSMAVELCIGVSTPGCSHYDQWQTHILSKYPVLVITVPNWKFLDLPTIGIFLHLSPTLMRYPYSQLAYVPGKTNTGYEALDSVKEFCRRLLEKHRTGLLNTQHRHESSRRE